MGAQIFSLFPKTHRVYKKLTPRSMLTKAKTSLRQNRPARPVVRVPPHMPAPATPHPLTHWASTPPPTKDPASLTEGWNQLTGRLQLVVVEAWGGSSGSLPPRPLPTPGATPPLLSPPPPPPLHCQCCVCSVVGPSFTANIIRYAPI